MSDSSHPASPSPRATSLATPLWRRRRLLVGLGVLAGLVVTYVATIRDFLAVTRPVGGEILVVESWYAPEPTLLDAVAAIREGHYRKVVCVALTDFPQPDAAEELSAERGARYLIEKGIDPGLIEVLSVPHVEKHRTYASAVAARNWQQRKYPEVRAIDIFTIGIHARKSLILFRKAFPAQIQIGVIAGTEKPYAHNTWWLSRRGIFLVARNTIGFLYALTFQPPASATEDQPRG